MKLLKMQMSYLLKLIPFGLIVFIWYTFPKWIVSLIGLPSTDGKNLNLAAYGSYSDAFGALNTLFAGLAFAGIVVSIFLQSKELRETRQELKGQRLQIQRQVFENTFFQVLRVLSQLISTAYYKTQTFPKPTEHEGRECINYLRTALKSYYLDDVKKGSTAIERYERFHKEMGHKVFGHYFRTLYSAVKYVHDSEFLDEEKGCPKRDFYMAIIRAQLSSDELFLFFFNCLSEPGVKKFKPLIEEYGFFEHLPAMSGITDDLAILYSQSAFGDSEIWNERLNKLRSK
jgi:Putative phage abortive infection protein